MTSIATLLTGHRKGRSGQARASSDEDWMRSSALPRACTGSRAEPVCSLPV